MSYACHQSGRCCVTFQIEVSPQELREMQAAGPLLRPLTTTPTGFGTLAISPACPWFDLDQHQCSIYESRPAVCRGYLCLREQSSDPFRTDAEQRAYLASHPEAREQATRQREDAIAYAREHGWSV